MKYRIISMIDTVDYFAVAYRAVFFNLYSRITSSFSKVTSGT